MRIVLPGLSGPLTTAPLRALTGTLVLSLLAAVPAAAQEVFRSEGPDGVVSFSDVPSEGAVRLELPAVPDRSDAIEAQQQIIAQQLAVAESLEASRLKREEARLRRLEAQVAAQPETVYYREPDKRYVGGAWWGRWPGNGYRPGYPGHPGYPGYPGHPVHPIKPPDGGHRPDHGGGTSRPLPPLQQR